MKPQPDKLGALRGVLELLAAEGQEQVAAFEEGVIVADELALDYDNWYTAVIHDKSIKLSEIQRKTLFAIDVKLTQMTDLRDEQLWTNESLRWDPRWREVRCQARLALEALGA